VNLNRSISGVSIILLLIVFYVFTRLDVTAKRRWYKVEEKRQSKKAVTHAFATAPGHMLGWFPRAPFALDVGSRHPGENQP
jgi:hypothetical protein